MPPKKKKPDAAAAAAAAALERQKEEEERRRKQEEEEKARQLEERIRQEFEEQMRKKNEELALERQEEESRRSREDEERCQREREREIQQLQLFEEKDKEILDLSEKLFALNRNFMAQQAELQDENKKVACLMAELEVAQLRAVEFEALAERQEVEFAQRQHAMMEESSSLSIHLATAKGTITQIGQHAETKEKELTAEIDRLRAELAKSQEERVRDDGEHTALLRTLNSELEKTRQALQQTEATLEKKEREDVRNTIMLGLLNSQVDGGREENTKLLETVAEQKLQLTSLHSTLAAAQDRIAQFEEEAAEMAKSHSQQVTHYQQQLKDLNSELTTEATTHQKTASQLSETKDAFRAYQLNAERKEKELFQQVVVLKAELEHSRELVQQYEVDAEKREKEHFERTAALNTELGQLKIRLQQLQDHSLAEGKEAFELQGNLKAELEMANKRRAALEEQLRQVESEAAVKQLELKGEIQALQAKLELQGNVMSQKEQEYFEQVTRLSTELAALQKEYEHKSNVMERRNQEYMDSSVNMNTEKEVLRMEAARLAQEVAKVMQEKQELIQSKTVALEQLRQEKDGAIRDLERKLVLAGEMQRLLHQEKETLAKDVERLTEEHVKKDADNYDRSSTYKQQISALKHEVEIQREVIEKLEGNIAESYNFKILAEQNDMLLEEVESYKRQIKNLNNSLSALKIEAEILEGHHVKALQEQNQAYLGRIRELEREHRTLAPLMREMVATLQKHGLSGTISPDFDIQSVSLMQTTSATTRPLASSGFGASGFAASSPDLNSSQTRLWPESPATGSRKLAPLTGPGIRRPFADSPYQPSSR